MLSIEQLKRKLNGHVTIGPVTIYYGQNAMHYAVNIKTRWGYICFHPTVKIGRWWPWYFYISPNGTPWAANFAIGPGVGRSDKKRSKKRDWPSVYSRLSAMQNQTFEYNANMPDEKKWFLIGLRYAYDAIMDDVWHEHIYFNEESSRLDGVFIKDYNG